MTAPFSLDRFVVDGVFGFFCFWEIVQGTRFCPEETAVCVLAKRLCLPQVPERGQIRIGRQALLETVAVGGQNGRGIGIGDIDIGLHKLACLGIGRVAHKTPHVEEVFFYTPINETVALSPLFPPS